MKNKNQLLSLAALGLFVVFILLKTNTGGFIFVVLVFILYVAFVNFYQKLLVGKEKIRQNRKVDKKHYEYYDSKSKTIKKIRKE